MQVSEAWRKETSTLVSCKMGLTITTVQAGSADKRSCRTQRTLRKWWVGPWWDLPLLAPSVWDLGHQLQGEVEHGIVLGSILSHRSQGMAPEDLAN